MARLVELDLPNCDLVCRRFEAQTGGPARLAGTDQTSSAVAVDRDREAKTRYDDVGISGGTLEQPALRRLLADIDAGQVQMVVLYNIDRLTRSLADFAKLVERVDAAGCSLVSVTQAFNTAASMGRLTINALLSFAQFEREVTAERIGDKIAASRNKGLWMGACRGREMIPIPIRGPGASSSTRTRRRPSGRASRLSGLTCADSAGSIHAGGCGHAGENPELGRRQVEGGTPVCVNHFRQMGDTIDLKHADAQDAALSLAVRPPQDGADKAEADPPRAMLGAVAGGAVHLTDAPWPLLVAEGIETALSLANGLLRGPARVWAALSTGGSRTFKHWVLS